MATVKYGTLELIPSPQLGVTVRSNFFGADIRYSRTQTYALKGFLLNEQTSGVSGIFLQQADIVTGFASDYQPFIIDGQIIGYPKVNSISFEESNFLLKDGYNIELEFRESGNPFQITGDVYGFTNVTGLFYNIDSLSESLSYNTDFKSHNYSHSVDITYVTGFGVDPLLNAKLIASGLLANKSQFPFAISGGSFGNKTYEERIDIFNGSYSVGENFVGSTGTTPYNHTFSVSVTNDANGITTVSQQGNIQGFDPNKYVNAQSGYLAVRDTIYPTCTGVYGRYADGILNNTFLSDSRVDDVLGGSIQYARTFTDETGVSDTRWQYTHNLVLEGANINLSENGSIIGLGHISMRFNQASGMWDNVRPNIQQRLLEQYSGFGATGAIYNTSRAQTFDKFNGQISYDYQFSNNNSFGLGSGIRSLDVTVTDNLPIHNRVIFNVIHVGQVLQNLQSTRQGERNVSLEIQAFRETPQTGILAFTMHSLNKHRPVGAGFIDPFINDLSLNLDPLSNSLSAQASYIYGGYKSENNIDV